MPHITRGSQCEYTAMSAPKQLRAEADKLYAKALDTENLEQRLKIVLRALELDVEAEVIERHDQAAA